VRVSVKFLSTEWTDQVRDALNRDQAFRAAAGGATVRLQQVITSKDDETRYWIAIGEGKIDMGLGDADAADATITESYETAVELARGTLSPVTAFMTGRIKITGKMGVLLGLQGALSRLPVAMASLDVDY
jgi:putative sterol carrier protein